MHLYPVEELMADHINNPERPERYEETTDPNLPPNVMVNKTTRNNAFWSYMGPVIALFVIFAIAMVYWMNNDSRRPNDDNQVIGTSGDTNSGVNDNGEPTAGHANTGDRKEGGFQPAPRPGNTNDEIENRGANGK
jgi:hypothetical protein